MNQKNHIARLLLLCASSFCLASCVTPPQWGTTSGSPEVLISGSDPQGRVIGRMIGKQWAIEKQTPNLIVFQRQGLSAGNRAIFAMSGDMAGIIDGCDITFISQGSKTRAILGSAYVITSDYGKVSNPPTKKAGDEFISTLSGL